MGKTNPDTTSTRSRLKVGGGLGPEDWKGEGGKMAQEILGGTKIRSITKGQPSVYRTKYETNPRTQRVSLTGAQWEKYRNGKKGGGKSFPMS